MVKHTKGALIETLDGLSNLTQGASDTVERRFSTRGARSVSIRWKATSGTPTISNGIYTHHGSARSTTLTDLDLLSNTSGASVAAGQVVTFWPDPAVFTSLSNEVPFPAAEMDVRVAGAVVGLNVQIEVLY